MRRETIVFAIRNLLLEIEDHLVRKEVATCSDDKEMNSCRVNSVNRQHLRNS